MVNDNLLCIGFAEIENGFISLLGVLMILVAVLTFLKIALAIIALEETMSVVRIFLGISGFML